MNTTEILCLVTIAAIVSNAALHWWFGNWFARERKAWIASNEQVLAAMRAQTESDDIEVTVVK